jgi:hypothetical protein
MRIELPAFATVTEDPFFTGGNLCRTTRADLLRKAGRPQLINC